MPPPVVPLASRTTQAVNGGQTAPAPDSDRPAPRFALRGTLDGNRAPPDLTVRGDMEQVRTAIELAAVGMEAAGVGVIAFGAAIATVTFLAHLRAGDAARSYVAYRVGLARSLLLGLELLVAGDIIRTVVVAPTLENIGVLAGIVLIRTFLSLTLELEVTGRFPWQRSNGHAPPEHRQV